MAKPPQFFHTLVHTHLVIPKDFFSKYIQGKSVDDTVELKSDSTDINWKVKMIGRRLSDGWEEFAVANRLQIGDVLLVRYEDDLVLHVSNLGPNCSETRDIASPSSNNDGQNNIGKLLLKKRLYPKAELDDDDDGDMELPIKKKVKKSLYTEVSCDVENIKVESIEDECSSMEIESSEDEYRLMESLLEIEKTKHTIDREQVEFSKTKERESPFVDSSNRDKIKRDENNKEESRSRERNKNYMTLTITPYCIRKSRMRLPPCFTKENDINKPGMITLLGKDGLKQQANLLLDNARGTMSLGSGWNSFVEKNGLKIGDSFTFKLIWEDTTPVLRLCDAESPFKTNKKKSPFKTNKKESPFIDSSNRDKINRDEITKEERNKNYLRAKDTTLPSENQLVTLTITPYRFRKGRLPLPAWFTKDNGINKPGMITLLGKDGRKHPTKLLLDKVNGVMALGGGWKPFVEENGLKTGDSFTLKLIWEDKTPVLSLCPAERSIDKVGGGCSETNQKNSLPVEPSSCKKISNDENSKDEYKPIERENTHLRGRDSTPSCQKQFVTLKVTPSCFTNCRLILPTEFARENSMNKPGVIYLVGKDGTKWRTTLLRDIRGTMGLGKGWKDFVEAHDLKSGESFTMELIWEDTTPLLSWCCIESSSSKANEKESVSTEPRVRDSSSAIQNQFVTLALTPEDVKACQLHLPSQFMASNGINKLGKITLLGENGMEWSAYLLSKDGMVALGNGWDEFCEANGVKLGESFTLELINLQDETTPVLKICL